MPFLSIASLPFKACARVLTFNRAIARSAE